MWLEFNFFIVALFLAGTGVMSGQGGQVSSSVPPTGTPRYAQYPYSNATPAAMAAYGAVGYPRGGGGGVMGGAGRAYNTPTPGSRPQPSFTAPAHL